MNHNFDWDDLRIRDDGEQEGSETDSDDDGSYHPSESNIDDIESDFKSEEVPDNHSTELSDKVHKVLDYMNLLGINLPLFLDALSWGDNGCVRDETIKGARTALMGSAKLSGILKRWWKPPHTSAKSHKARAAGARATLEDFAMSCLTEIFGEEMKSIATILHSSGGDIKEKDFTDIDFEEIIGDVKEVAPNIWSLLRSAAYRSSQVKRNTKKDPDKIVLMIISMLAYTRSHHSSRIQKLFAIYLKFRGLSAKAFDTLHALAFTMSHRWTADAVGKISKAVMEEVLDLMEKFPWLISHDNVNIPFRVFSQRLDNFKEFGSGSAATVYIKRRATALSDTIGRDLQECRARGLKHPLTALDILKIAQESYPRIHKQASYHVLRFLVDSPEFDSALYDPKMRAQLVPPKPIYELPCGEEHITLQYLLGTVNIPEASYEDNERLLKEWFKQLGLDNEEDRKKLGHEKVIAWVGDQLTVDRLRGLFLFHGEDSNSFERMDWLILVFGWLHLQMAFINSLRKQYMGTSSGRGILHTANLLNRKGLTNDNVKGPYHHDMEEALYHMLEAHLLIDWLKISGATSLRELRNKTPQELFDLADQIVRHHASSEALDDMGEKPVKEQDEVKYQTIMFNRDALQYVVLDHAIKHGNVGLMEDMLPHLLYRFVGGQNSKYSIEILELLQGLHREWPYEMKTFVREHCWLVNMNGRRDGFLSIDMAQEHNIKDIKVTYRSEGPKVHWDYLKKIHPAVRVIRALTTHMEKVFQTYKRGKSHTIPKKDADVQKLRESYVNNHQHINGRVAPSKKDKASDITTKGAITLNTGPLLSRWSDGRDFERTTYEIWDDSSPDELSDDEESNTCNIEPQERGG